MNKINGHIDKSNGNKYLPIVRTDGSKDLLKTMKNYRPKQEIKLEPISQND